MPLRKSDINTENKFISLDDSTASIVRKGEKVVITGDDLLIEFCDRLLHLLRNMNENSLIPKQ